MKPWILISIGLVLLVSIAPGKEFSQSNDCPPAAALLPPDDPVYADAMVLAGELRVHGFTINCIFPSKLGSIFQVDDKGVLRSTIEGEVAFRTNEGDIEVVFIPKPQTFEDFRVTEHHVRGGWWYSFAGPPRVWKANHFASVRRTYFMKRGSQMFILGEGELRLRVMKELNLS